VGDCKALVQYHTRLVGEHTFRHPKNVERLADCQTDRTVMSWLATPALHTWISTGVGNLSALGLGDTASLSPKQILQSSMDRLALMSWGLASGYHEVLAVLLAEEEAV
jgi:hypothetical protein